MNVKKLFTLVLGSVMLVLNTLDLFHDTTNSEAYATDALITLASDIETWDGTSDISWYVGSEESFYLKTAEELAGLSELVNINKVSFEGKKVFLENDISLENISWDSIGSKKSPYIVGDSYTYFDGTFDGQSHSIYGLRCSTSLYSGLFGRSTGTIKNVNIVDCNVSCSDISFISPSLSYAGGICGYSEGSITNCNVSGKVSAAASNTDSFNTVHPYAGGVCGYSDNIISNCSNSAEVMISGINRAYYFIGYAGGICGYSDSIVSNCQNSGTVMVDTNNNEYSYACAGGICGGSDSNINYCVNSGDITTSGNRDTSELYTGGICAYQGAGVQWSDDVTPSRCILKCSNSGNVTALGKYPRTFTAGILGYSSSSMSDMDVSECSNFGNVISESEFYNKTTHETSFLGGVSGSAYSTSCYNWGELTGNNAFPIDSCYNNTREDCYSIGAVNGNKNFDLTSMVSNEAFAESLGDKFVYIEGELPALAWEIERNIVRPNLFTDPGEDDYPDENAVKISSREALIDFAERIKSGESDLNAYLLNDIELEYDDIIQIGTVENAYNGVFDGNDKTISGVRTNSTSDIQGLFGFLSKNAIVKNLHVNGSITSYDTAGGICAYNSGTIQNCTFEGYISGGNNAAFVGGICGSNSGKISGCIFEGEINVNGEMPLYIGGICGYSEDIMYSIYDVTYKVVITDCINNGNITCALGNARNIGGICGSINSSMIARCSNYGEISTASTSEEIGGICGENTAGNITDCYNTASVSGGKYVAGICGYTYSNSNVCYCFNLGEIEILDSDKLAGSGISYGVAGAENSYYLEGTKSDDNADEKTAEEFADGSVCVLLNSNRSSIVWYQADGDPYPVLDSTHKKAGDVNIDGQFNIADAVTLQKWLLNDGTELANWKVADLCEDGKLDVFDIIVMKRQLLLK